MKFKILLLLVLALCSLGSYSHAQSERSITIYMENGDEKELKIQIPSEVASRSDEYVKAYTMLYMEWWNNGVGANHPYMFDVTRFKNTTPPKRITALAGNAAEYTFLSNNLQTKVALEARTYLNDLRYTGDENIKEVEIEIGSSRYPPYIKKTVQIPERFRTRSVEYARGYNYYYRENWNKIAYSKDTDLSPISTYTFDIYESARLQEGVGGDIKNHMKKIFSTEEIQKEIESLLGAHMEKEKIKQAELHKKWAEEEKRMGFR